jgi:hypothetical protein
MVQTPTRILPQDAKVKELIDEKKQWWNIPLIEEIFMKEEAEVICSMVIRPGRQQDRLVWGRTKNKIFLVRSIYHLAQSFGDVGMGSSSSVGFLGDIWCKIWTVKGP